jgi:drug/metabolite transporter (DMT)-like permease
VQVRHPLRSAAALYSSKWFALGMLIAVASWGLHVAALALAPISLVQTVIAGGLALLTVLADRVFGYRVTRREWIGVALTAAGLAFLAGTMSGVGHDRHSDYEAATLATYVGLSLGLGLMAAASARRTPFGGPVLAVSAGLLWGASDVSIKALSGHLDNGALGWIHPLALVTRVLAFALVIVASALTPPPVRAVEERAAADPA